MNWIEFCKNQTFHTLLLTNAGNWHWSPRRTTCSIPRTCSGINDSHSFNCEASSITKNFMGPIPSLHSLYELEAVQKIIEAILKQNLSFIFVRPSPSSETRRFLRCRRHSLLRCKYDDIFLTSCEELSSSSSSKMQPLVLHQPGWLEIRKSPTNWAKPSEMPDLAYLLPWHIFLANEYT